MSTYSKTGLDSNTASALSYVLGPITGLIFLFLEKDLRVRFHAMQSTLLFSAFVIVDIFLNATIILASLGSLLSLLAFGTWLFLIYKAWAGEDVVLPFFGIYSKKLMEKV